MVPCGAIVTRPGCRIALGSGVSGAGQHHGPKVRLELQQSFVSPTGVLHAEYIVNLAMIRLAAFHVVNSIQRHGFVSALEKCGLIHVIPIAADPYVREVLVQSAPPAAHFGAREVRKNSIPGPDFAHKLGPVGVLHEVVTLLSFIVRLVARQMRDVQVGNRDDLEAFLLQILDHAAKVGKTFRVYGKRTILELIVDVQVDHVRRNLPFTELRCQFPHRRLRIVAVPALLVSQRE